MATRGALLLVALAMIAACGPSVAPAETALAAFVELGQRPDLSYRFTITSRPAAGGGGGEASGEGVVVGRDSSLVVTQPGGEVLAIVITGDRFFQRFGQGEWEQRRRDPGFESNDVSFLLPLVAGAGLAPGQTASFEGRTVHQLGNRAPIRLPMASPEAPTITRVEVLVDDAGRPVRLVAELATGGETSTPTPMGLFEMRFSDVGAVLQIEAPAVR